MCGKPTDSSLHMCTCACQHALERKRGQERERKRKDGGEREESARKIGQASRREVQEGGGEEDEEKERDLGWVRAREREKSGGREILYLKGVRSRVLQNSASLNEHLLYLSSVT